MQKVFIKNAETIYSDKLHKVPNLTLKNDEIHVWETKLNSSLFQVQKLNEILSSEEQIRAERYHFKKDREYFIIRRGVLKVILGGYSSIAPHLVKFISGSQGKPYLKKALNTKKIHFNVSHSKDICLIGITRNKEIGIDIEQIRNLMNIDQIAADFFSESEYKAFQSISSANKTEAFFNCWVRKEAFIKATGSGLAYPLHKFDVSLVPGDPARLLSVSGNDSEVSQWAFHAIDTVPGYVGAVCIQN